MHKKRLNLVFLFLGATMLMGCHSEQHLSPKMELGESMIIHHGEE